MANAMSRQARAKGNSTGNDGSADGGGGEGGPDESKSAPSSKSGSSSSSLFSFARSENAITETSVNKELSVRNQEGSRSLRSVTTLPSLSSTLTFFYKVWIFIL